MRALTLTLATFVIARAAAMSQLPGGASPLLGLDEYVEVPASNPMTPAKIALGRKLFFDRALSADRTISCASCHRPELAFGDTARRSRGIHGRSTARNVPSILNRAYGRSFFWDGRAASLEETVLQPIESPREMGARLPSIVGRLRQDAEYRASFLEAFHDSPSATAVAQSLASYVRALRSAGSPVDRYFAGERDAISPNAARGMDLFLGKANCASCHSGPLLSDERFHITGVSSSDRGRELATGRAEDEGAFKVPSLRNVAVTAPYMHDGSLRTLESVVDFYDRGGGQGAPHLDVELRPLRLSSDEKKALIAFLRSLTSSSVFASK